jgi:hypothetical protein
MPIHTAPLERKNGPTFFYKHIAPLERKIVYSNYDKTDEFWIGGNLGTNNISL